MKLFIDCEYNSMGGQLISMALVPEEIEIGSLYFELPIHQPLDPWVKDNVIPILWGGLSSITERAVAQQKVAEYLAQFETVHLIADWPDDIKYFCEFLITGAGTRLDTPPLTLEIRRDLDAVSNQPHHALHDAMAMRDVYQTLV